MLTYVNLGQNINSMVVVSDMKWNTDFIEFNISTMINYVIRSELS